MKTRLFVDMDPTRLPVYMAAGMGLGFVLVALVAAAWSLFF